ncbi:MAG: response regulator [Candidatus Hydrogenedentes bacterium]|nr:response regulator [Candidatus Hydrogenedentota bacterium]
MSKILIAEDEPAVSRFIVKALEGIGHTGIVASNGQRAWTLLNENTDFDLLITDVNMPEMNGLDLITQIRASDMLQHLPIIIVSGKVTVNEISAYLDTGASCFMGKPIELKELRRYVGLLLNRRCPASG